MIYIIFFALLIFGAIGVKGNKPIGYLFFILTFLWIIIGMRDISVGPDTESYVFDFRRFKDFSFSQMINDAAKAKEPMYVFVSWLPSCLSTSYTMFLFTWALFPIISFFIIFKKELKGAKDYLIAVLVFFLLGLFAFYVAGIRQTAALSLVLIAYKYFKQIQFKLFFKTKNIVSVLKFAMLIAFAYMIHNSAIIFTLAFFVRDIKVRSWYVLIVGGLFFLGNFVKIDQIVFLSRLFFEDRFANYGTIYESSQSISAFVMQIALFIFCFFNKDKLIKGEKSNTALFNIVMLGMAFQSLSGMLAEFARISFYFSIFYMILVPRAMQEMPVRYKRFGHIAFVSVCLIYLFFITSTNLPEYKIS